MSVAATTAPASDVRPASAFWQYWTASVISQMGSAVTKIALPVLALVALNASNFEVSLITVASYAAIILIGLPAGVIADRLPLRALQVTMDLSRAALVASIAVAWWLGALTLAHVIAVAFIVGLASNIAFVANASFLPAVVPKDQLTLRNGQLSATLSITQLIGPAFGGLLVQAAGAAVSTIVDAVSYVTSAVLLGRLRGTDQRRPARPQGSFVSQIAVGLRFVMRHPIIRPSILAASAVNFSNGAILAATPPFVLRTLHLPASMVGVVMSLEAVGVFVAALFTARLSARFGDARVILWATAAGGAISVLMPLAFGGVVSVIVLYGVGSAGLAAGVTLLSVITRTHRQVVSPPEVLSRVMASVRFITWGATPLGALAAGVAATVWGPREGLVCGVVGALLAPVALLFSQVSKVRTLLDAEPAAH
ncbi:MFS transporter [Catellatospora tritici]|uniref:MFS transporter n=1 Tax=Catellatospora tritici TaxID=2851566 RepID=UPI001C2D7778|nr:MFS transporter [Catellatospora tritici]MBV1849553.1 MFS transporter [Catellatospora tritici]